MHLAFRNVNDVFDYLISAIHSEEIETTRKPSRAGEVLQIEEPMTITYIKPLECVLFNMARDANPFFHLFEALWMLAGRNDLAPLQYYNSTFGQFSDDGVTLNGAYGYRWRNQVANSGTLGECGVDQLEVLIAHLKAKPESRRAVLQMWNVQDDLLKIGPSHCVRDHSDPDCVCSAEGHLVTEESRDVCCNLSACFLLRREILGFPIRSDDDEKTYLDITVFNRSNDLVLGMLGANAVHFSFLLEYMASCLGVGVGRYNQISNNLHCYSSNYKPELWLADETLNAYNGTLMKRGCYHIPLVSDQRRFDVEVQAFIDEPDGLYHEPFLNDVAAPMCLAFRHHKDRDYTKALEAVAYVKADDWRFAGQNWLLKRKAKYEDRNPYLSRESNQTPSVDEA